MNPIVLVTLACLFAVCSGLNAQTVDGKSQSAVNRANAFLQERLCEKLEELLKFKAKPKFKEFGFGRGGPYHYWVAGLEAMQNAQPKGLKSEVPIRLRIAPAELIQVGMEYMNDPKGTNYTKTILPELKEAIDYKGYLSRKRIAARKRSLLKERTWKDKTGKFSVAARFVAFKDGQVTLVKRGAKRITLPIAKLSDSDRKLILTVYPPAGDNQSRNNKTLDLSAGSDAD